MKRQEIISIIIKRTLIGLGAIVLFAIVAFALMKLFYKQPIATVTTPKSTLSSTEIVKKYSDGYKLDGYIINTSASDSLISYKLSDSAYTVQVNSLDNVQFTKSSNSITNDITRAANSSKQYLTDNGFSRVVDQTTADQTRVLLDDQTTVCKTFNSFNPTQKASAYGLVCADKKQFIAERNTIETLAKLYSQTGGIIDFKDVVRTTIVEGNKALSMLSINPQDKSKAPYTLIFAAIDDKWSYIGSRVTPLIDSKDSFKLSAELKTTISDPKYNGFIVKYIK